MNYPRALQEHILKINPVLVKIAVIFFQTVLNVIVQNVQSAKIITTTLKTINVNPVQQIKYVMELMPMMKAIALIPQLDIIATEIILKGVLINMEQLVQHVTVQLVYPVIAAIIYQMANVYHVLAVVHSALIQITALNVIQIGFLILLHINVQCFVLMQLQIVRIVPTLQLVQSVRADII